MGKIPRSHRYTPGESTETSLLKILELSIRAKFARDKASPLDGTNAVRSAPQLVGITGVSAAYLRIGNSNGKLFKIDSSGNFVITYNFGAGLTVSDILLDNTAMTVGVAVSSGKIYYVPQ